MSADQDSTLPLSERMLQEAYTLQHAGLLEDAIAAYAAVDAAVGAVESVEVRRDVLAALQQQANVLTQLGRAAEAAVVRARIAELAPELATPSRSQLGATLAEAQRLLNGGGDVEVVLDLLGGIVRPYWYDLPEEIEDIAAYAMILTAKAALRAGAGNEDAAIQACDEVITRYRMTEDDDMREIVAWGMLIKGGAHGDADRFEHARLMAEEAIAYLGNPQDEALVSRLALAHEDREHWIAKQRTA